MKRTLLVILSERLSDIVAKGEFTPRYYNPGDFFDTVHILLTNDDHVDPADMQISVGRADVHIHNLPVSPGTFARTLGWRPALLEEWAKPGVELARSIGPHLVRCHGNAFNAYLASRIKKELNIPYVVSLHGNPDVDYFRGRLGTSLGLRVRGYAIESVEVIGVTQADHVIAVYQPIVSYLEKHGVTKYSVIYNAVGYGVKEKSDYKLATPRAKVLCVGRQQTLQKDPAPIIRAVAGIPGAELTLVGDGDLHPPLKSLIDELEIADRVRLIPSLSNTEVLKMMHEADIFAYSSINYEISKTCIEAALTGLPIVLNDRGGEPAPELVGGHFLLVDGSTESFAAAISRLIEDDQYRAATGRSAFEHATRYWSAAQQEAKVVKIYSDILEGR